MVSTNKDIRDTVADAVVRGWVVVKKDRSHDVLRNGQHRVGITGTPSDKRSAKLLAADLKRCEKGECLHGGEPATVLKVDTRADRLAKDRERNERALREAELRLATTTHTPTVKPQPKEPMVASGTRRKPKVEKAAKWLAWYLGEHSPREHPQVIRDGMKAGHADATIRKAMTELECRIERRGPQSCALVHSKAENTLEAHTLAGTPQEASTAPARPVSGHASAPASVGTHDRAVDREWARLEGMAAMLPNDWGTLVGEQVQKLRALIGEAS